MKKLHKSCRKGQAPPALTYFAFEEDKALYVLKTLNEYINRSKPWRESNHEKQLLLSSIRPHNAVVSCTISGWLKKTLKQAGINTDLFKAHSIRSTSSSKTSVGGAPLVEILKRGSCSHHSTWQRFYNEHKFRRVIYFRMRCIRNTIVQNATLRDFYSTHAPILLCFPCSYFSKIVS